MQPYTWTADCHPKNDHKLPKLDTILDSHKRESLEANLKKEKKSKDRRDIYFLSR